MELLQTLMTSLSLKGAGKKEVTQLITLGGVDDDGKLHLYQEYRMTSRLLDEYNKMLSVHAPDYSLAMTRYVATGIITELYHNGELLPVALNPNGWVETPIVVKKG